MEINFLGLCLKYVKHLSGNKRCIGTKKSVGIFLMMTSCGDERTSMYMYIVRYLCEQLESPKAQAVQSSYNFVVNILTSEDF